MIYIYIFYRHLSTFLKLVGLTLISCCFACVQNPPCKNEDRFMAEDPVGLPAWDNLCEIKTGKSRKHRVDLIGNNNGSILFSFTASKSRSDSLLLSSAAYMYFTNTSLWAVAGRNVIPAECEWLYLPIVRWHFQEIIRSSWNNSVPIV